ncbi:MAG: class I tRNA ligase family protein [Chloroflexi bacterium]|nr:class I tRNA ligase family protein [Chloroflexota bacterium]
MKRRCCTSGLRPSLATSLATIEWAKTNGEPDAWRHWWQNPEARTTYFVGKDNIPFHAVFWPAQLFGAKGLYADDPQQAAKPAL